jgi:hypothetical protein
VFTADEFLAWAAKVSRAVKDAAGAISRIVQHNA